MLFTCYFLFTAMCGRIRVTNFSFTCKQKKDKNLLFEPYLTWKKILSQSDFELKEEDPNVLFPLAAEIYRLGFVG